MQMREAAEKILFAQTLEEKLDLVPEVASDDSPGKAILVPDAPGRPQELMMSRHGVKATFPGVNRMDQDRERGKMMHFLANHELMAAELMALVLLKFPDAPKEYRAGVYEAMREEQIHTLMYMRRMRDCGIHFGELPVNDYFWKLVAPMETPMDFVTRLNLTFEQSNLDFSKYYARLFREVDDTGTAAVLEKIYLDEINHVGHGVKWFRKWKKQGQTDWEAFKVSLTFPLAPAKAKGLAPAPFNVEGRKLAGLDDDFIRHLEICEQSRGRTPVMHTFNPNAESYALAKVSGLPFQPNKMELAMERDLEIFMLSWCRKDDLILMNSVPSYEHLSSLKKAGFDLPEIIDAQGDKKDLTGRKLGGMRPWAWSPDMSEHLQPFANQVSKTVPWQWQENFPTDFLSKKIGVVLNDALGLNDSPQKSCTFFTNPEEARTAVSNLLSGKFDAPCDVLLKAPFACAGRGHRRVSLSSKNQPPRPIEDVLNELDPFLSKTIKTHGGIVVEPWVERVLDFSSLYEILLEPSKKTSTPERVRKVKFIGMTLMENDASGRFMGTRVYAKWGVGIDHEVLKFLFKDAQINLWYRQIIPDTIAQILPDYLGPVGVDAMVFRRNDGSLGIRYVVELNVRMTMGRVAWELQKKSPQGNNGHLRILRKKDLSPDALNALNHYETSHLSIVLNDPQQAQAFIAVWESTKAS